MPAPQHPPRPRRLRAPLKRRVGIVRRKLLGRAPMLPTPLVPASPAQRAKVAGLVCVVCERSPVDPAHVVPQRLGGCADPACVLPLCRVHHRLYDQGELRLAVHIGAGWRAELAHALCHTSRALLERALDGQGWPRPSAGGEQ